MTEYLFSSEVVRVTFIAGVVVSVLFYERLQLTTGGAIVPAYLALGLREPVTVVATVSAGYITYLVVNKVIGRQRILYGRRKFDIEVIVGLALVGLITALRSFGGDLSAMAVVATTIGFLVPGLIAHDMGRQGPIKTAIALAATTLILALFLTIYLTALHLTNVNVDPLPPSPVSVGFNPDFLLVAVACSVLLGMALFETLGVRSGGFISAAYIAFVLPRWADLLFLAVVALITWFVAARILLPRLLLFGRRKLSCIVIFGALLAWTSELLVQWITDGRYSPAPALVIMALMIPALIANDAERQGWEKTAWGVGLATLGVFGVVNVLAVALAAGNLLIR